jgi:pimeloyl-ACP methyl ester carboxylesterase
VTETLHVTRRGTGPVVALVHGTALPGRLSWAAQKPLADKYELWIVDRRGYGDSPPLKGGREDFEVDAQDLLQLIPAGAHLVAISYGTVGALIAAAQDPQRLASLTLIECPAFPMAPGDHAATQTHARLDALHADNTLDDHTWFEKFVQLIGAPGGLPKPLPSPFDETVAITRAHRRSYDGDLPLDALAAARVPVMVMTSGEHDGFEAVADHLTAVLDARRERLGGFGHLVPLSPQFNDVLDNFLASVEAERLVP